MPDDRKTLGHVTSKLTLIRIVAPHFEAGLETGGVVRRAAPILHYMVGCPDDRVRAYVKEQGWKASVVAEPSIKHHFADFGGSNAGSFEVRYAGVGNFSTTTTTQEGARLAAT